jgi:hypothetical protein
MDEWCTAKHTVFEEEFWHNRWSRRDLAQLEA